MKQNYLALLLTTALLLSAAGCSSGSAGTSAAPPGGGVSAPASAMDGGQIAENYGSALSTTQPQEPTDWNTEEYNQIKENSFQAVSVSPLSTFAADVDTASYTNLRRMLTQGQEVPPDAVRLEEMLNYFRYDYPAPAPGEPFSVSTELAPCPWNPEATLLRVGLQAAEPDWDAMPKSNLVFLIDVSGSMDEWNKLPLVKQAFLLLTENLRPGDRVSIVTYASEDRVVLDGAAGNEPETIQRAIEDLQAGGGTAGARGIQTAYELARKHLIPGGNNRVILATDGDLNIGVTSEGELARLVETEKKSGVFLSVMGFGEGNLKDNKMEALADNGDGNYSYIDSVLEAKRVLVEEMGGTLFTVAKDVKLQLEFNPEQVKGYRLVGYENRLLAAEDFADDAKDGGEIGAGHRVTALYELIPAFSDVEVPGADLKYQKTETTGSGEWLTVNIRYKEPDGAESQLLSYPVTPSVISPGAIPQDDGGDTPSAAYLISEDTAFAAAVAEFGMLLRNSEYIGGITYQDVAAQLEVLASVREDPYRQEFYQLVLLKT